MFYVEGPVFSPLCGYAAQNLPGFLGPIQEFLLTTDMTDVLITSASWRYCPEVATPTGVVFNSHTLLG
jgi:hypothetical protein